METKTKGMSTQAKLEQEFSLGNVSRADVMQALIDDGETKKEAKRIALTIPDNYMKYLADQIRENSCETGTYWQLCKEIVERYDESEEADEKREAGDG